MFCPQCEAEYQTDISKCADCGVPLVSNLEEIEFSESPSQSEEIGDFKIIFSSPNAQEVEMVKSLLEASGVFPLIYNPFAQRMNSDIKIFVHKNQRPQADKVLKTYMGSVETEELSTDTGEAATSSKGGCSICGNQGRDGANFCDQCGQPLTALENH